jgi:hypothetical protein
MAGNYNSNSNIFAIDFDAIRNSLNDANLVLTERVNDILAALDRLPSSLETSDDIHRANKFARQIDDQISEVRRARLLDGKPFRVATTTVKSFFDEMEKPLKKGLETVLELLTETAEVNLAFEDTDSSQNPESIGIEISGETIVSINSDQTSHHKSTTDIHLTWNVESFDRDSLDLEALRNYLTDRVILTACKKHLADHGPNQINGVEYQRIATPR